MSPIPGGFRRRRWSAAALIAAALACSDAGDAPADFPGAGRVLTLELTTRLEDGSVVDSTEKSGPLVVTLGEGRLLPALERQLGELQAGAERQIVLEAADAYGEPDPELLRPVPIDRIPEDSREVGKVVIGEAPDGTQRPLRVHEVKPDEIVLDLNHPLAGQKVRFDVKVLKAE
jgi:FKBP-type peptidyl-prolyl cis-trans isomerase 2